jgi:hypothetical protein
MASPTTRGSLPRCWLEKSFGKGCHLPYAIFCRAGESALAGNVGQSCREGGKRVLAIPVSHVMCKQRILLGL